GLGSDDPSAPVDNVLYPYSVASLVIVSVAQAAWAWVVTVAAVATAVYVGITTIRFGGRIAVFENGVTYWAYAIAGTALTRRFREMGADLDAARQQAVVRERALVQQRERSRHEQERAETCRVLHDHVLQTMEFLSRDGWLADDRVRREVDREAAWLRELIRDELGRHPDGLGAALGAVVAAQTSHGLDVELNIAAADEHAVAAPVTEALAGAVHE